MSWDQDIQNLIKLYKDSEVTLTRFIQAAGNVGMPVRMLKRVREEYTVRFLPGGGTNYVEWFWNNLILYENTVKGLRRVGKKPASSTSVLNLYHEAAHAVIDIDDIDDTSMFDSARIEFARAKLTNGKRVSDADRVTHEAVGCYVGHRAAMAWAVWEKLAIWNDILDSVEAGTVTVAHGQNSLNVISEGAGISGWYDLKMQEQVFGYQEVGSKQIFVANYPMPSGLRAYCDGILLENKIYDTFARMSPYTVSYDAIKVRLAKVGLREKP